MRYSKVQPTNIDSAVQSGRTAQRESTKIGEDAVTVHDATTGKGRLCGRKRQDLAYFAEDLSNSWLIQQTVAFRMNGERPSVSMYRLNTDKALAFYKDADVDSCRLLFFHCDVGDNSPWLFGRP